MLIVTLLGVIAINILEKIANIVTILGFILALFVLLFGDNIFQQATQKDFFEFFRSYNVSQADKAALAASCIFFIIGLFFTSVSLCQPPAHDSHIVVILGLCSLLGAFVLFLLFLIV